MLVGSPDKVRIQLLQVVMGERRADEVAIMEDGTLRDLLEVGEHAVLDELGLQEGRLVDRAVEEPIETEIPEIILTVLLAEEVGLEIISEVLKLLCKFIEGTLSFGVFKPFCQASVE